jgi:hypothetical protein
VVQLFPSVVKRIDHRPGLPDSIQDITALLTALPAKARDVEHVRRTHHVIEVTEIKSPFRARLP